MINKPLQTNLPLKLLIDNICWILTLLEREIRLSVFASVKAFESVRVFLTNLVL